MKPTQITNPKDGRDVFILGAGFSKAVREIMPTLDELGQEIRQESRGQDGPQNANRADGSEEGEAREWPTPPIRRGPHQQPVMKPMKWAEPNRPSCWSVKPSARPEITSKGPRAPEPSCSSVTESSSDEKDRIRIMSGLHAGCGPKASGRNCRASVSSTPLT